MNTLKTAILMGALGAILVTIGAWIGGTTGIILALGFAIVMNVGMYWYSDKLAIRMSGAKEVTPEQAPELHAIVDELVARSGMPKPKVHIIPTMQPNAFATGRDPHHSSIAVTQGLLRMLEPREVRAVLAHELGHVANRDILVTTIAAVFASAIAMIANIAQWALIFGGGDDDNNPLSLIGTLALIIVAPIAAAIVQMAISRSREHGADAYGAEVSGEPLALASALVKIEAAGKAIPYEPNPATASLYIQNPLHGGLAGLFSTHPRTIDRVNRLRRIAGLSAIATGEEVR